MLLCFTYLFSFSMSIKHRFNGSYRTRTCDRSLMRRLLSPTELMIQNTGSRTWTDTDYLPEILSLMRLPFTPYPHNYGYVIWTRTLRIKISSAYHYTNPHCLYSIITFGNIWQKYHWKILINLIKYVIIILYSNSAIRHKHIFRYVCDYLLLLCRRPI